jgi:hypothetical protein
LEDLGAPYDWNRADGRPTSPPSHANRKVQLRYICNCSRQHF